MTSDGTPPVWDSVKLADVLHRVRKSVQVEPDTLYREIGIRSHGKGIFYKEERTGDSLGDKSVFWIEPDCFVVNIVFAWEQAVAKTTQNELGMIASHRFPMYKPLDGKVDLDYLLYFFKSPLGKYLLGLASPGGAGRNKTLGQKGFLDLSIPLPSMPEQQKITDILSTWDIAIKLMEQLIAAKQNRKLGLMQQLLTGTRRFKGFNGEWNEQDLGDLANVRRGASPRPIKDPRFFAETGRGWIRISDATSSPTRFLNQTTQYLSPVGEEKSVKVEVGDLIMSICATIGVPRIVNIPACIHDGFVAFSDYEENLDKEFLYHYISFITEKLADKGQPGTQKNLNSDIVRHIKVPHISLPEQRKISSALNMCDEELDLLTQKLAALKRQKQGLMQQLLTGRVRVKIG